MQTFEIAARDTMLRSDLQAVRMFAYLVNQLPEDTYHCLFLVDTTIDDIEARNHNTPAAADYVENKPQRLAEQALLRRAQRAKEAGANILIITAMD